MSTKSNNERPMFRVTFSRITGKDDKGGGIIVLDLIPVELSQRQGVLFLVPVDQPESEGSK